MVKSQQWINENFPNREEKEKVKKLYIKNDQGIDSISGQSYYFYKVQLEGELNLSEFANLNYLDVRGSSFGVGTYQRLTKLDLNNCSKLENIYVDYNDGQLAIEGGSTLNSIHLENCQNLVDFQISNSLTNLKKLNVKHCDKLVRISDLNKLVNLKEFSLYKCLNLTDLNGLNKLTNLTSISVKGSKLTSLELAYLDKLSNFSLDRSYGSGGNPWLTSVSLTNLNALTSLSIEDCPQLTNLKLIHLDNLTSLKLNSNDYCSSCCPQLGKIEGLEKLVNLLLKIVLNYPSLTSNRCPLCEN